MAKQDWDRARWAWVLALLGGLSYFFAVRIGLEGVPAYIWKTSGVAMLTLWVALNARGAEHLWMVSVLAFGALGDLLLATSGFLVGGSAFAIGHFIAIAFYMRHHRRSLTRSQRYFGLLVTPLALVIAWQLVRGAAPELIVAAMGYTLIVALMTATAWTSRFSRYRTGIGAFLFLCSDLFIFAGEGGAISKDISALLVWPLYFVGQALIAWGVVHKLSTES